MPSAVDSSRCPPTGCEIKSDTNSVAKNLVAESHISLENPQISSDAKANPADNIDKKELHNFPNDIQQGRVEEPRISIYDNCVNLLKPFPALKNAFELYAKDQKLAETDAQGIKTKISLLSNQLSVYSNLLSLVIPDKPAFEKVNKVIDKVGQFTYRSMIGISAFAKFTKVSQNNDLIASVMSFAKTIFALNAQNLLAVPLRAAGVKANLNLPFENFYSWLGFTNGPMNISSAAANTRMGKEGYKNIGESLSVFKDQITETTERFKNALTSSNPLVELAKVFDPRNGVGVHGTLGGVLQLTGFLMKQTGLIIKDKVPFGEALVHSGSMLRNNIACWLTDIERFSLGNMKSGKVESVASGVNYSIEGVLDELQQIEAVDKRFGKPIRALMGLFGTWAAATNAEGVKEERKDFEGKSLIGDNVNLASYGLGMLKAAIKANLGHSLPPAMKEQLENNFSKPKNTLVPA